ncbi:MAG: hypothetical protein AAF720_10080 [Pseudomonadota bacterium]
MAEDHKKDPGWADTPGFRRGFLIFLGVAGLMAVIAGFIPAFQKKELHFALEAIPVFFAVWGFGSFMFIVMAGRHLRKFVSRKEGYYDELE